MQRVLNWVNSLLLFKIYIIGWKFKILLWITGWEPFLGSENLGTVCGNPDWKGDGHCDDDNNNEGCNWDGGDCCGANVDTTYCSVCECLGM